MSTVLLIIGIIILLFAGLAFYKINANRPKYFKGSLKTLEKSLFQELENKLLPQVGVLVPQQLNYLKRGVRLYFPKSYSLELYEDKNNSLPEQILFNRKDEFKLCTISFVYKEITYKAEFKTYSGRVWGITVRPSPKKILNSTISSFGKFTLHQDPTEELDLKINRSFFTDTEHVDGLVNELKQFYTVTDIQKPLPVKQQELFIRLSETKFPPEYIELCSQTNGFMVNDITFFGLGELTAVSLDDDNFLMLAENSEGCLAIKQSKRATKLKFYSYEDETNVKDLGDNFYKALQHLFKEISNDDATII